jgi:hypothetical protein
MMRIKSALLVTAMASGPALLAAAWLQAALPTSSPTPAVSNLLREGTKVEWTQATLRMEGERLRVIPKGEEKSLLTLENLAAQRIVRVLADDPEDNRWTLAGSITEFDGRNFLLIDRAVRAKK